MLYNNVLDIKFGSVIGVGAIFDYMVLDHLTNNSYGDISNIILC